MRHSAAPSARPRLESLDDRCLPSAGALDPTFGTGGLIVTDLGSQYDRACAMAIQPDGKLVAVGDSNQSGTQVFAVTRYTANGALDGGFGSGGVVKTKVAKSSSS